MRFSADRAKPGYGRLRTCLWVRRPISKKTPSFPIRDWERARARWFMPDNQPRASRGWLLRMTNREVRSDSQVRRWNLWVMERVLCRIPDGLSSYADACSGNIGAGSPGVASHEKAAGDCPHSKTLSRRTTTHPRGDPSIGVALALKRDEPEPKGHGSFLAGGTDTGKFP